MVAHVFHVFSRIPVWMVGYRRWSQLVQQVTQKYSFELCNYEGVMTAPVHTTEERGKKSDYLEVIDVIFEEKHYHAPKNYDTYLTQLYGNYMQIPPKEEKKSHHDFYMYWTVKK